MNKVMIQCSVCKTENHHLSVNCRKCGGFVQQKIEALDLFSTSWMVIESPARAFHRIAIATHKNYIIFLSAVAGIGLLFTYFWLYKIGDHVSSLPQLLGIGISAGFIFGELTLLILSLLIWTSLRFEKQPVTYKQVFAVSAYSMIPVIISVLCMLPVEIMTFGTYFFASNPSPYDLKPFSYIVMITLDSIFGIWTLILLGAGVHKLRGKGLTRSLFVVFAAIAILGYIYHLAAINLGQVTYGP